MRTRRVLMKRKTSSKENNQEDQNQMIHAEQAPDEWHARIARLAYHLYEQRGRDDGQDLADWCTAEREILGQENSEPRGGAR